MCPDKFYQLYEIIYNQRLNASIADRTGEAASRSEALINIKPYTNIISIQSENTDASREMLLSAEGSAEHHPLVIASQNIITHDKDEETYDAIVYATGYIRSAWVDMLKSSDIGEYFGLTSASTDVRLVPSLNGTGAESPVSYTRSSSPSTAPSSARSTPPTSPEMSPEIGTPSGKGKAVHEVYISRNYRLVPESKNGEIFGPRIYLQGVEESTHGLSDTLLSVLGVRAGEVVNDLAV